MLFTIAILLGLAAPVAAQTADRLYVMDCGHNSAKDQSRWSPGVKQRVKAQTATPLARNWNFESMSLQRTVRLSQDFSFLYRKASSCRGARGPAQATWPAETRRARQRHANCR